MKTLLFSDTHLSHNFDRDLFDYIVKLVKSADQVIINGDFWDAYMLSFDEFCNSKWKALFPLLKQKHAIYIFGNHDKKEFMDDKYSLFSEQQFESYQFQSGDKLFIVSHGHFVSPAYDRISFLKNPNRMVRSFYNNFLQLVNLPIAKQIFLLFEERVNVGHLEEIKTYIQQNQKPNQIFIFGHSHIPELNLEQRLISTGPLQKHHKSYCIIEDGIVEFFSKGSM